MNEAQVQMNNMKKIVVHGGAAHLDDYMAASLAWAWNVKQQGGQWDDSVTVERRDPTEAELADPSVWVLDVGGRLEPESHNWDHHQLPRGSKECAMTLLATSLGVRDVVGKLFPWFEIRGELDATGPFATAKAHGLEWSQVSPFLGPFEDIVLDGFQTEPTGAVRFMAERVFLALVAHEKVASLVRQGLTGYGLLVTDFTAADPEDVRIAQDAFLPGQGVAIFHDDRGAGLTLLRINDDPLVDFSRVDGDPDVVFAHKGGFIAKTVSKDMEKAMGLIARAFKA